MATLETNYASLRPILLKIESQVRDVIGTYAADTGFLISSRVKSLESILDKIETGRYKSLSSFDDLVAFTVIIDTRSQHYDALGFLKRAFSVSAVRGESTLSDERLFDFDATRVYAQLKFSEPSSPLSDVTFEVQIRTLLQHAWSKITHPLVYKARQVDGRKIRLAAELLATIEGVDRSLSTFNTVARRVKKVERKLSVDLNNIVSMVDNLVTDEVIPPELRPINGRRFAENVRALINLDKHKSIDALGVISNFYTAQAGSFPRSVTLNQLATIALLRASMLTTRRGNRQRYHYVTQEMISLFPDARDLLPQVVI